MFQYIPLLKSLKQHLKDNSVLEKINKFPLHCDCVIEDICDGERFASHPLFKKGKTYMPCKLLPNPLGSHVKKHKLGIGHVAPKYRSQLKAINVAILQLYQLLEEKNYLNEIL